MGILFIIYLVGALLAAIIFGYMLYSSGKITLQDIIVSVMVSLLSWFLLICVGIVLLSKKSDVVLWERKDK